MIPAFDDILRKQDLDQEEIKVLLAAEGAEKERLLQRGLKVKLQHLDNYVHLRGLIEFGNVCEKNCFYCGLRSGNEREKVGRNGNELGFYGPGPCGGIFASVFPTKYLTL